MVIEVVYPKQNTSVPNWEHTVYPYVLRGISIERSNQVWQMDITYIGMATGFMYLAAIIDVHSISTSLNNHRMVVRWDISNTM